MIRSPLLALLGLAGLAMAACAPVQAPPMRTATDTGHSEGGIGGTGVRPDEEGGLGGTGVFGTITGLGSIHLNGLRVEIPAAVDASGLDVGDTVAVETVRSDGTLTARSLADILPLVGPVDRLDPERRQLSVMGTPVVLDDGAIVADRSGSVLEVAQLEVGEWLQVSGIWRSGAVVASRLVRVPAGADARVTGLLGGQGTIRSIGGTAVDLTCCSATPAGFASVAGSYRDGRLVAERSASGTATLFAPSVDRLVVEAFLARNPDDPGFHLSGFGIPMDPASPVPPAVGQRSIFVGRLDGDFLIERSYPVPGDRAARLRALDEVGPSLME